MTHPQAIRKGALLRRGETYLRVTAVRHGGTVEAQVREGQVGRFTSESQAFQFSDLVKRYTLVG